MILSENLLIELNKLNENINSIIKNKPNATDIQLETFLRNLEKRRYNILTQINLYNKTIDCSSNKIKTINDGYIAKLQDNVLHIYIPEVMPSYRNLKTHAYKNILLNLVAKTKPYENLFNEKVFIYIKIFNNIKIWDVDNKFIKAIPDALILSKVIQDDNINKMFYCVKGEYSENPHTEVMVFEAKNNIKILDEYIS